MFLLPWGFFLFLSKEYLNASILFTAYIITLLIREILEARLLGDGMHLNAFVMLAAIFIGIELFGIGGILLGSVVLSPDPIPFTAGFPLIVYSHFPLSYANIF